MIEVLAKLTLSAVAQRSSMGQWEITRLERLRVSPSFAALRRYAEATGSRLTVGLERFDS